MIGDVLRQCQRAGGTLRGGSTTCQALSAPPVPGWHKVPAPDPSPGSGRIGFFTDVVPGDCRYASAHPRETIHALRSSPPARHTATTRPNRSRSSSSHATVSPPIRPARARVARSPQAQRRPAATQLCRLSGASTPWRRSHSPPTSSVSPSNARPARRITRSAVGRASRAGASERRHRVLHRRVSGPSQGHVRIYRSCDGKKVVDHASEATIPRNWRLEPR